MMIDALGAIAQLVEHLNGIEGVSGSSPLSSILRKKLKSVLLKGRSDSGHNRENK